MKKYLVVFISMLFVLGMVGSAFAIHADIPAETQAVVAKGQTQISLSGAIRVRGEIRKNVTDFNDDNADTYAAYDQRVTLGVNAKVSPNTEGQLTLRAGDGKNVDNWTWGNENGGIGVYPIGESKRGTLNFIEAWILHKGSGLLGIPAGVKVGHMPLKLGNALFFDHSLWGDDAIVFFMDPTKELHIGLLTDKLNEGATAKNDDSTAYVGLFTYKAAKDVNISGDITYLDDQANGYNSDSTVNPAGAARGTHLWNFGLRGDAKVAGFGLKADIELQTGKSKQVGGVGGPDISNRGYAFMLGADYTLAPVKISLDYAYGSGDDNATDNKNKTFITAQTQNQTYAYVYNYRTKTAYGAQFAGLSNTNFWRLALASDFTKDLSGELSGYLLRASKKRVISLANANGTGGLINTAGTSKNVGTEIDGKIVYKIDRNLNYWVEGGYLFAGAFYDQQASGAVAARKSNDAYAVRHGIELSF